MLEPILASTSKRIAALKRSSQGEARVRESPRDFEEALGGPGLAVIGEVKRRSPSRGVLAAGLDAVEQARVYARAGAAAVSVLTEPDHFDGSNEDLTSVVEAVEIPVLRKDFILDPAQVWESARIGADALLLIVAILDDRRLGELLAETAACGLAALVEVHDAAEAERALSAGARIVGVNNRDLRSFHVDLGTAKDLAPLLAGASVRIAESGIHDAEQAAEMAEAGYDAVLVGEALVRACDPGGLVARMRGVPV